MEVLSNILLKEVDGSRMGDKVVFVDNLPKNLLFQRVKKQVIDQHDPIRQQRMVPAYEMVNGNRILTNEFVDELLPGIEKSPTGDDAFVFFTAFNEAKERLKAIDHYLRASVPVAERLQERIHYALQPGVMTSGTKRLEDIPRIVLPAPVSPPVKTVQEGPHAAALPQEAPKKKTRRPMSDKEKEAARQRMARAREVRRAQQIGDIKA